MRRLLIYVLVLAAAAAAPVRRTDLGKLKPVETVYLGTEGNRVVIRTDTEDIGSGSTLESAVRELKDTASGIVYLETADYLLVGPGGERWVTEIGSYLKERVYICRSAQNVDVMKAASYLSVHTPKDKLKDWGDGSAVSKLTMNDGRFVLE